MIKKPTIVFVGTYPPRECGIATFNQDLLKSIRRFLGVNISCKVAALNISHLDNYVYPPEVTWQVTYDNKKEYSDLGKELTKNPDISGIIVQHEYGIYGGKDGGNILTLMENCNKPILTIMHTVLPNPNQKISDITGRIIKLSNSVVVLARNSRNILERLYPFSVGKVYMIPHGIHDTAFTPTETVKKKLKLANSTVLSTFGLLSRGKGIEYIIKALPEVIKKYPSVLYLILGETHPIVRRSEGESYRLELIKLAKDLNLNKHVKFYDKYLDLSHLIEFLKATDIYISTSINPDQAVSGTLSCAMGTGRAVISTEFAQAKEIITPENGRLVPIKNSESVTLAISDLLSDKKRLLKMYENAYKTTRSMLWSRVAEEYSGLLTRVVLPPISFRHLRKMTDDFGLFQFAHFDKPNEAFGYTLDDNARALVVCSRLSTQENIPRGIKALTQIYLNFVEKCQKEDGSFYNYIGHKGKKPTLQNKAEDLSDAQSRAMWALSDIVSNPFLPTELRTKAERIFRLALPKTINLSHLRSKAFMIKSFANILKSVEDKGTILKYIDQNATSLSLALEENSNKSWKWFESHLGYNNALLSESLIIAGSILENDKYIQSGIQSLEFLIGKTFTDNMYLPIGHSNWYKQNEKRSHYDQQPEDPASMVMALMTIYKITGIESYKNLGNKCFSWFLGNNSLRQPLYNYKTGGCFDGLHPDRVNSNQGAESLVSYLLSRLAINEVSYV